MDVKESTLALIQRVEEYERQGEYSLAITTVKQGLIAKPTTDLEYYLLRPFLIRLLFLNGEIPAVSEAVLACKSENAALPKQLFLKWRELPQRIIYWAFVHFIGDLIEKHPIPFPISLSNGASSLSSSS